MKLLFDQNLSRFLPQRLSDVFPDSSHLSDHDLSLASDAEVWDFAKVHGFVLVSKDDDFRQRSFLEGAPPKVVCVQLGNCSTRELEQTLRDNHADISEFAASEDESFMIIM